MFDQIVINFHSPLYIIDFILMTFMLGLAILALIKMMKRRNIIIVYAIGFPLFVFCKVLCLNTVAMIVWSILIGGLIVIAFVNIGDLRPILANKIKTKKTFANHKYDKEAFLKVINDAISNLSRSRTGALISFERNMSLADYYKSGTMVNAPVSAELLETIFYEGTRLHDGAVIVHDNMIVCASVYYTPTTRPLTGKYGARHRAAIGISEVTDALTVIVSEETGRISLAYNGILEPVKLDEFPRIFENAMSIVDSNH